MSFRTHFRFRFTFPCLLAGLFVASSMATDGRATPTSRSGAKLGSQQDQDLAKQEAKLRDELKQSPDNSASLARLGSVLALENRFEESALWFEKALKVNPGDVGTRRSLATSYWQMGNLEQARKNLDLVLRADPRDKWAAMLLGMVSEDLGDHRRAAQLLSEALPLAQQRPEPILTLATAYYQLKEHKKARATLQRFTQSPADARATFSAGRLAAKFADYEMAEQLFSSIRTSYPDAGELNYNLALAQYSANRFEETQKTLLESIHGGHNTADISELLGWTYAKTGHLPEMLQAFEKAINLEPGRQSRYVALGDALLEKENFGTALEVAKEMIRRFPDSAPAYRLQGATQLRMYLLTEALASYGKAVELDPKDPKAALGLALAQWNASRTEEAAKSFEEGIRKFPQDGLFHLKYAIFLLNSSENRGAEMDARIKELLLKSEKLDDSLAETHFQLGNVAMKEDKYEAALGEMREAAKLDPEMPKVHYALSRIYRRMGRDEQAAKESELHRKLKEKEEDKAAENAAIGTRHP